MWLPGAGVGGEDLAANNAKGAKIKSAHLRSGDRFSASNRSGEVFRTGSEIAVVGDDTTGKSDTK